MAIETNYRRLADMEDNIKALSGHIDTFTKELARLRAGFAHYKTKFDDYKTKIGDAKTKLEDIQTQHETATAEFNALIQKTNVSQNCDASLDDC